MMLARDNPFRTDRVLAFRFQPQGWTWDELMRRLAAMNYRGAIVGPHGSGKTTLLEDLEARLNVAGQATIHIRLWDQERAIDSKDRALLANAGASTIVLVDGAEQLSMIRWTRLRLMTRRCRGLIVTQHREGRLPTVVRTQTSPQLLGEMVRSLEPHGKVPHINGLYNRHHGNIRDAIREMYDLRSGDYVRSALSAFDPIRALE